MSFKHVFVAVAISSVVALHAQEQVLLNGQPVIATRGAGGGFILNSAVPIEGRVVKGAPYSAEVVNESIQTLGDGNRIIRRSTGRVYRDSEGRTRREEDRPSGTPSISITDPTTGSAFTLDPVRRVAVRTRGPVAQAASQVVEELAKMQRELERVHNKTDEQKKVEVAQLAEAAVSLYGARVGGGRGGGGGEQTAEKLADRIIEGVRAEGRRRTTTIAAGAIGNQLPIVTVSEEWSSPELQMLLMTVRKDPREGESTYQLNHVIRAEPDRSLFLVPSDYTIQEPGGRGRGARTGGPGFEIRK